MDDDDNYARITLRIPKDVHQALTESSKVTSKSMNAEIISRVQASFENADFKDKYVRALEDLFTLTEERDKLFTSLSTALHIVMNCAQGKIDKQAISDFAHETDARMNEIKGGRRRLREALLASEHVVEIYDPPSEEHTDTPRA